MKYLFVLNPVSGGFDKDSLLLKIENSFSDYRVYTTNGQADNQLLAEEISKYQPSILVAIGGDGTILLCSETIMRMAEKPLLGIIPAGSANGMAEELHIPHDYDSAIDLIKKKRMQ